MARSVQTHIEQETPSQPRLFLAFELGKDTWKLGFTIGVAQQPRARTIPAGDVARLQQEITRAKQRFDLPEDAHVTSCYEAGRDGFWLHRSPGPVGNVAMQRCCTGGGKNQHQALAQLKDATALR